MSIRGPSLTELNAFLAVARTGSFRKAALELYVTQAAVSRTVLRLEQELGNELFLRASTGVTLTTAGAQYRKLIENPVAALRAAAQQMQRKTEQFRLRLSVITSLGALWLMPRLNDFRHKHPEIEIEFRQYHHDEDFTREDIDVWIALRRSEHYQWPRHITAQYLIGGNVAAVCTPDIAKTLTTPQLVVEQPLLYHSNFPQTWDLWAHAHGVTMPLLSKGTGFDLSMNLLDAARSGMGVALVETCLAEEDLRSGKLIVLANGSISTGRGYFLCRRRAQETHPAVDMFAQWVAQQALISSS